VEALKAERLQRDRHGRRHGRPVVPLQDRRATTSRKDVDRINLVADASLAGGAVEVDQAVAADVGELAAPVVHRVIAGGLNPQDAGVTGGLDGRRRAVSTARAVAAAVAREAERAADDLDVSGRLDLLLGLLKADGALDAVQIQVRTWRHLVDDL